MAHQEVFQQQIIINQLIKGRLAYWEGQGCIPRDAPIWHPWSAQGWAQKEDSKAFLKSNCKVCCRFGKQHTRNRKPLDPSLNLAATLCHLDSGAKYSDMQNSWEVVMKTLSIVVREVCNAMFEEHVDGWGNDSSFTPEEWKLLTEGFYKKWNFSNYIATIEHKHIAIRKRASSGSL